MKCIPNNVYARYGLTASKSWALVTGATDGIGLALCKTLAKDHGYNVVMVGRSEEKLEQKRLEVLQFCDDKVEVAVEV